MAYRETYKRWLEFAEGDEIRQELNDIKDDDTQIKERFYSDLPFGTAGLRGIIGAGIARINRYTVGRATQGLSEHIKAQGQDDKGMAIAYDSRRYSREFAEETACVFAANGIKAYLFEQLTSVPELSFAVQQLKTAGGVVITASHNPKDYNGYKVYASYGGQLGPDESLAVMENIQTVDAFGGIKRMSLDDGIAQGLIEQIGEEIDKSYYESLLALSGTEDAGDLNVVYTPLHGSGLRTLQKVLPAAGIRNLHIVSEQSMPDGFFPTIKSPNPEDADAMKMAIELAKQVGAHLAIGTDPDADRMGAVARDNDGSYRMLTGNQIGCILIAYLLEKHEAEGQLSPKDYIIKSFVSTTLADAIAAHYGIASYTVLTGFRFISEIITQNEGTDAKFIFGFEESYGFLAGTGARDKDGQLAALLLCKAAQHYRKQGKCLFDVLNALYEQHGYYLEAVRNVVFTGLDGMERMKAIMAGLRETAEETIGGLRVLHTEDYQSGLRISVDGKQTDIGLPKSNAVKFMLEGGAWACVRPSGTEPKIKLYFAACDSDEKTAKQTLERIEAHFEKLM